MCFGIRFYKSCGCPGLSLPACPLVGMTPPPVKGYKGFPLQAAAVGTQRLCLLFVFGKQGGRIYIRSFPNKWGKSQIPNFATPAAYRISTKNTMPAAWCISAPLLFQPRQGARELLIGSGCQKCFCVTFAKSNKTYCRFRRSSAPAR